ncbi:hypothetical protein BJV74DRAFT_814747 [Russula compacta]|nr:hypothetical protein BJV74DRAFT_814747 [Russula compacta]
MSARFVHGLRIRQLTASGFSSRPRHVPSSSRVITTTLTFDASAYTAPAPSPSPTDSLVAAKMRDLLSSLERVESNPSRPWGHYLDLLNYMGLEKLPLEVHQLVLRKCVPPANVIRAASAREHRARYCPQAPHAYENRLQIVMKNIRSAGWQAELDDYHFVLQQFAAVGHYVGSKGVLQEMAFAGLQPRTKTYRLCLQALAYRLTLPCSEERRLILIEETTKTARELIRDMRTRKIPFTSANMDLAIRILRETVDEKGFDELIKFSYGIDLAYPDRLPLEVIERQSATKAETSEATDSPFYPLQPLSTPGLNVIVDMLGRTRRISKMVQAFEVLTHPLPKLDEDDYSANPPSISEPIYPLPSAPPNSSTFQLLIKHASRAGHGLFARHYLVYAMRLDRDEDRRLKGDLRTLPVNQIAPPLLAVNRNMFLPVFGLGNREKHVELIRWTLRMINRTLRRKRKDLLWYTYKKAVRYDRMIALDGGISGGGSEPGCVPRVIAACPSIADVVLSPTRSFSDGDVLRGAESTSSASLASAIPAAGSSTATATPSPTSRPNPPPPTLSTASSASPSPHKTRTSILDVDLDSDLSHPPSPSRIFDINAHISLLQRDIEQLERLASDVEAVFGRTIHRIKERLGRRVWSGKDVWLRDEQARVPVAKEIWKEAVNFVTPRVTKLLRGHNQRHKSPQP